MTDGGLPLNTHGGLLSYGHPDVAGGMAHVAETVRQMRGLAKDRQMPKPADIAFLHGDGGVLSAHVSLIRRRSDAMKELTQHHRAEAAAGRLAY